MLLRIWVSSGRACVGFGRRSGVGLKFVEGFEVASFRTAALDIFLGLEVWFPHEGITRSQERASPDKI